MILAMEIEAEWIREREREKRRKDKRSKLEKPWTCRSTLESVGNVGSRFFLVGGDLFDCRPSRNWNGLDVIGGKYFGELLWYVNQRVPSYT